MEGLERIYDLEIVFNGNIYKVGLTNILSMKSAAISIDEDVFVPIKIDELDQEFHDNLRYTAIIALTQINKEALELYKLEKALDSQSINNK